MKVCRFSSGLSEKRKGYGKRKAGVHPLLGIDFHADEQDAWMPNRLRSGAVRDMHTIMLTTADFCRSAAASLIAVYYYSREVGIG